MSNHFPEEDEGKTWAKGLTTKDTIEAQLKTAPPLGHNPKDRLGVKKPSMTKVPFVAILHESMAMMDGGFKYGPFNWRENEVIASIYIDALLRHIAAWFDARETYAADSGVHHLGHARACLGILLDAEATGNLIDDRPKGGVTNEVIKKLTEKAAEMAKKYQKETK